MFKTTTRSSGLTVHVLADDAPEHVRNQVKNAHSRWSVMPSDVLYEVCAACEDFVDEGNDPSDDDFASQIAERWTPVYFGDLVDLMSRESHLFQIADDEMVAEFGQIDETLEDRIRRTAFYLIEQTAAAYMDGFSAGPGIEVWEADEGEAGEDGDGDPMPAGWYWQACFPGCLPDSDPFGPFKSEGLAIAAARSGEVSA